VYKSVIFYFSGTGNTWWVADRIKKQLDARNINADIVSIDSVNAKKANWWIKTADLVFFGWPVYGSDLPAPMKRFIDNLLPIEKGKHIHTFCTQMGFSGDGAWVYHKRFEEKGLTIDSAQHFIMPSNMSYSKGILSAPTNDEKIAKIMEKCGRHVERYVDNLLLGKSRITGKNSYLLGMLQRAPYSMANNRYKALVGVDVEKCTKCGLCASLCPAANITMKDYPEFGGKCEQCFRCYALCPQSAITYKGKTHDVQKTGKPYIIHDKRFKPSVLK
jgi:flavodoxin/ferredoxin